MFDSLIKYYKEVYDESPFKSIILDIRSILPKKGQKTIKKGLKYIEEIKEFTSLQTENDKNDLIRLRNDLIEKFKKNNKFHGLKDKRNLFNKNDDNDEIYDEIYDV